MANRRISKASKRRLTFFGTISLVIIIYFLFSLLYNTYSIFSLSIEKSNLEKKYVELQEKSDELKTNIEKLNDPEYLANYARENYLYSKPDEYIIQLSEDLNDTDSDMNSITEVIDNLKSSINKNYIIATMSILMILIFVYIVFKGKKKKRK